MALRQRIRFFLLRKLAKIVINGLLWTCRIKILGIETLEELRKKNIPIIYVNWHRHIFFNVYRFKNTGARPLISLSPDGEIIAQIAVEFGMNPVRGSSSKGGAKAFLKLVNAIKEEKSEIIITTDGPKGPQREVKEGTILLAQKTGSVIVPICWNASRAWILEKTWDKFIIPLPFSKITFVYGKPFMIPGKAARSELQKSTRELKAALDNLEKDLVPSLTIRNDGMWA